MMVSHAQPDVRRAEPSGTCPQVAGARRLVRARASALLCAAIVGWTVPLDAQTCQPGRTALVLAGGGARGLAHIGVIRALERAGIHPDLIVGTSMGALIGALYASGYTAAELDGALSQLVHIGAFRAYAPRPPASLRALPPTVLFEQTSTGFVVQNAAVREGDVNAVLDAVLLRGNLAARGDFDALPIPFRAIATDLGDRSTIVLGRGDLARAVRASIALPLLFAPVPSEGRMLADGGLSANVPVEMARQLGAEHVIVSRVSGAADSVDFHSQVAYAGHLVNLLFRQAPPALFAGDVDVRTATGDVSRLDFSLKAARMLVDRGDQSATTALAKQCGLPVRQDRLSQLDRPRAPPGIVRIIAVNGHRASDVVDVEHALRLRPGASLSVRALEARLLDLRSARAVDGVWLNPFGPRDSVQLDVTVDRAPRRVVGAGFAYDSDVGGRVWTAIVDRQLGGLDIEGSAILIGGANRKELVLGLRRVHSIGKNALTPTATVQLATESVRAFDDAGTSFLPLGVREAIGFLGLERALGVDWVGTLGAETRAWSEPNWTDRAGAGPRLSLSWLPQDGRGSFDLHAVATNKYQRVDAEAARNLVVRRLTIRPRVRAAWGKSLPLQLTFPLGGNDGFAGLRRDELRGDSEGLAALLLSYRLVGPLLLRAEVMAGRIAYQPYSVADSTGALPATVVVSQPDNLFGARAGFGIETPVGPIRVEYGLNSRHRHSSFIRLGRWF